MIYEDYNRPYLMRKSENLIKILFKNRIMSLGIMQIKSPQKITDEESIELAAKKLSPHFKNKISDSFNNALMDYNRGNDYTIEVGAIFDIIEGNEKKEAEVSTI